MIFNQGPSHLKRVEYGDNNISREYTILTFRSIRSFKVNVPHSAHSTSLSGCCTGQRRAGCLERCFLVSLGWPCVSGRASPRTSGSFQIFVEKKASASERVIIVLKPGVS